MTKLFAVDAVLFCATTKFSSISSPNSLIFDGVIIQRGQGFNLSTSYFNPPVTGNYFFHLYSSLIPYNGVQIEMKTLTSGVITQIYQASTIHNNFDMTSFVFMGTFTKNAPLYLYVNSGTTTQTSWSAFLLDNLMYPLIAFCARPPTGKVMNNNLKIVFADTNFNIGNAWNSTADLFTAQRTGVYVFSVSFSVIASVREGISVIVRNAEYQRIFIASDNHNGYIMTGKTFALYLSVGDTVYLNLVYNNQLYSSTYYSMSFAGFLYEPLHTHKVIWSVHRISNINGQYNPLPFEDVSVNVGNGWNTTSNKFLVPYAGVYQLHLTATSIGYAAVDYRLMWNDVAYASLLSATVFYNNVITRSRSIMIEASVGDTFYIATTSSTNLYGSCRETSFTGYLIVA